MLFLRWKCRRVRHELWDYAGNRLSEGPMEAVEQHLHRCGACRREVAALRTAQHLLHSAQQQTPRSRRGWGDLHDRLHSEGLTASSGGLWPAPPVSEAQDGLARRDWRFSLAVVGSFAALLLVTAVGIRLLMPPQVIVVERFVVENKPTPSTKSPAATPSEQATKRAEPALPSQPEKRVAVAVPPSTTSEESVRNERTPRQSKANHSAARIVRMKIPLRKQTKQIARQTPPARKPDTEKMRFVEHRPTPEEQVEEPQTETRRNYVLPVLTPVSNTEGL